VTVWPCKLHATAASAATGDTDTRTKVSDAGSVSVKTIPPNVPHGPAFFT